VVANIAPISKYEYVEVEYLVKILHPKVKDIKIEITDIEIVDSEKGKIRTFLIFEDFSIPPPRDHQKALNNPVREKIKSIIY